MVDRLKAGDRTIDFTEFRMAYTETDGEPFLDTMTLVDNRTREQRMM